MNYTNLAQKTNFIAGSDQFENLPFYLTTVSIPGITFSHIELGGRTGAKMLAQGDTATFNNLTFEMLIDEDFTIYHEFMDEVRKSINVETGTFADRSFSFWVEINNSKGNPLFKIEFYECRIESIGDIELSTQDSETEYTMSVDVKYTHHNVIKTLVTPTLKV